MKVSISKIETIIMQIAIVLTILSFSPDTAIASLCDTIMFVFWGGVVFFKFLNKKIRFDNYAKILVVVYVVWFLCTKLFYSLGLYPSGGMGVAGYIVYCIIFYIIGLNFNSDEEHLKGILDAFFVGEVLLMLTLLPYLDEISKSRYAFGAKNQMGQMLGMGVILGFFILFQYHKNIILKIAILFFSAMSLMSLLIVGSRTPLIAIIVIAIVSFASKKGKTNSDYTFAFVIIIAIGATIAYLGGIEYILELFDLGENSSGIDINNMTSGRLDLYKLAFENFLSSPLIGLGAYAYIDNFIINILRCGGVLLAVLILPVSYGKMFVTYKEANKLKEMTGILTETTKALLMFYFVVSMMEGFPPLGPNTSVFFLWIFIGIMSGKGLESSATGTENQCCYCNDEQNRISA